jgi:hypothetical protein
MKGLTVKKQEHAPDTVEVQCVWVQDLSDIVSPSGQRALAAIRSRCNCSQCKAVRRKRKLAKVPS